MKKIWKITKIVLLSLLGIVLLGSAIFYFGSKLLGARQDVSSPIYQPNKEWVYEARFYNPSGVCTDSQTVTMRVHDERFMLSQTKISWIFENNKSHTGVVEKEEKIWIHPPRMGKFKQFTEFAPFPELNFPLKKDKTWKGTLFLGSYATEESGEK